MYKMSCHQYLRHTSTTDLSTKPALGPTSANLAMVAVAAPVSRMGGVNLSTQYLSLRSVRPNLAFPVHSMMPKWRIQQFPKLMLYMAMQIQLLYVESNGEFLLYWVSAVCGSQETMWLEKKNGTFAIATWHSDKHSTWPNWFSWLCWTPLGHHTLPIDHSWGRMCLHWSYHPL